MTQVVGYDGQVPRILAIETTHPQASVALLTEEGRLVEKEFESHREQNQLMFDPLVQLLTELESESGGKKELDLILVGIGPGSYGGARIAIAAAQGVGVVYDCEVVGLSSFYGLELLQEEKSLVAVGDARRGEYFMTEVSSHGLVEEPELMGKDCFLKAIEGVNRSLVTMETLNELPGASKITSVRPRASLLVNTWLNLEEGVQAALRSKPIAPAYLRAPYITKAKAGHPLLRGRQK